MKRRTIDLQGRVPGGESIEFLRAQALLDPPTPLVIVQYKENGEEPSLGLRLDLDKSSFLDHFEDAKKDRVINAAVPRIVEIVGQTLYPFEAVGVILRKQYPLVERDAARPGIWIVPGAHGSAVRAYVPLGIDAVDMSPVDVAGAINRFVQTDLFIVAPVSCKWYFVLCGSGWTDDLIANIQLQTRPRFTNDEIEVVSFDSLAANQNPLTVQIIPGDLVDSNISQAEYVEEALKRVQGVG